MTKAKKFWFKLTGRMHKMILWESLNRRLFLLICKDEFWGFLKTTFWSTWAACLHYLFCGITWAYRFMVKLHCTRNMVVLMIEFKKWDSVPSSARPGFLTAHSWSMLSLSDSCPSSWRYAKPFSPPQKNAGIFNRKVMYYYIPLHF